jgi:hypothetical protein
MEISNNKPELNIQTHVYVKHIKHTKKHVDSQIPEKIVSWKTLTVSLIIRFSLEDFQIVNWLNGVSNYLIGCWDNLFKVTLHKVMASARIPHKITVVGKEMRLCVFVFFGETCVWLNWYLFTFWFLRGNNNNNNIWHTIYEKDLALIPKPNNKFIKLVSKNYICGRKFSNFR